MSKYLYLLALSSMFLFACQDEDCKTSDSLSFSNDIQPIFNDHCATSGCHNTSSKEGGLDLSAGKSYAELSKSGSGYINTSKPTSSVLYSEMRSDMPPSGKLDDCTLEKIEKWMEQGAKNN
ncbi:MAG: c-type cytochrome domain-containing protein [Flavobacteriales bacterium]